MKELWFEAKAEKTLESVNAAFDRHVNTGNPDEDFHFESMEKILIAEEAGYIEFENGIMRVYV